MYKFAARSNWIWNVSLTESLGLLSRTVSTCTPHMQGNAARSDKLVLGCGSNVIDHIYHVKTMPKSGEKGFFKSPLRALDEMLIGGVTLNHLAWAALGGVPTGLLALQGQDNLGKLMRREMENTLGVSTEFIQVSEEYHTSQCHVFIHGGGERTIIMAPASTSTIDEKTVLKYFEEHIKKRALMVTTEVSQVPLSGVKAVLQAAKRANVLSVLDLDIPPSVAITEAKLGTIDELVECVQTADIIKPTRLAATELLAIMNRGQDDRSLISEMAVELTQRCNSQLVAITDGSNSTILANKTKVVKVPGNPVLHALDSTGAGDAFLGGLIVGISKNGLPRSEEQLSELGRTANGFGAACVQSVGGVPVSSSRDKLKEYLPEMEVSQSHQPQPFSQRTLTSFTQSVSNDLQAARSLLDSLDLVSIEQVVQAMDKCKGQLLISGVGKSGHVGQRFAGSLRSVGLPAHFIHATEFVHGDLGVAYGGRDMVIFFSNSGNTEECVRAAYHLTAKGVCTVVVTGGAGSKLSKLCTFTLRYGTDSIKEPFGCLPSSSIVVQEMLCNGLLTELIARKAIQKDSYKDNHPGGNIGRLLST